MFGEDENTPDTGAGPGVGAVAAGGVDVGGAVIGDAAEWDADEWDADKGDAALGDLVDGAWSCWTEVMTTTARLATVATEEVRRTEADGFTTVGQEPWLKAI